MSMKKKQDVWISPSDKKKSERLQKLDAATRKIQRQNRKDEGGKRPPHGGRLGPHR